MGDRPSAALAARPDLLPERPRVVLYQHHMASPTSLRVELASRGFEVREAPMFRDVDAWLTFHGGAAVVVLELPDVGEHRRAVLEEIRRVAPLVRIVALADALTESVRRDAAETGATELLPADAATEEIAAAVESASSHHAARGAAGGSSSGARRTTEGERVSETRPPPAAEALRRLQLGNERFLARGGTLSLACNRSEQAEPAVPTTAVVACSDLRVPLEQVFDVAPGCLYVVQSAANLVGDGEMASAAFAQAAYGVELVVVMGHAPCGIIESCGLRAVSAAGVLIEELSQSRRRLAAGNASEPVSASDVAKAHASRMADVLRERLAHLAGFVVVAAHLDEPTGRVDFL